MEIQLRNKTYNIQLFKIPKDKILFIISIEVTLVINRELKISIINKFHSIIINLCLSRQH